MDSVDVKHHVYLLTQKRQQRPESATLTPTRHASNNSRNLNERWSNYRSVDVTQTQRPESPTETLTWHPSKFYARYINSTKGTSSAGFLTLPLFWRRSTVSPVFFGRYPRSSLHSFVPPPPHPPPVHVPNKPPRFCGRKAKWSRSRSPPQKRTPSVAYVPSSSGALGDTGVQKHKISKIRYSRKL